MGKLPKPNIITEYKTYEELSGEIIEHNKKINWYPLLTSGKWHLIHHKNPNCNYGVFFPIWDIIFHTNKKQI